MWVWRSVLCVSLVCGLGLDHNTIRSSKEATQQSAERPDRVHGDQVEHPARRRTETTRGCSTPDCYLATVGGCSNRAQRRPSSQDRQVGRQADRQVDRQVDRQADTQINTDTFNRTKAPEMSGCVRSGDCAAGLCCVRYLTGRRCQRIPERGEACMLRGSGKLRRKLGRCDCAAGLSCAAAGGRSQGKPRAKGCVSPAWGGARGTQGILGRRGGRRRGAANALIMN